MANPIARLGGLLLVAFAAGLLFMGWKRATLPARGTIPASSTLQRGWAPAPARSHHGSTEPGTPDSSGTVPAAGMGAAEDAVQFLSVTGPAGDPERWSRAVRQLAQQRPLQAVAVLELTLQSPSLSDQRFALFLLRDMGLADQAMRTQARDVIAYAIEGATDAGFALDAQAALAALPP